MEMKNKEIEEKVVLFVQKNARYFEQYHVSNAYGVSHEGRFYTSDSPRGLVEKIYADVEKSGRKL